MHSDSIKMLVSVKDVEEALAAIEAGADYIDLKDPSVGALGNLNHAVSQKIIQAVNRKVLVSATVGDSPYIAEELLALIKSKADLGVDIVKLDLASLDENTFFTEQLIRMLALYPTKLVGVFFANKPIDLNWIATLKHMGFYGVMLDTSDKTKRLLACLKEEAIAEFVKISKQHQLHVGLAGSLRLECLDRLVQYAPDYLGFRSGVCEQNCRENKLLPHLVKEIKEKLCKHNNSAIKVHY